jgi:hypothetical protein
LQNILEAHDNFSSAPPKNSKDIVEEEEPEEDDSFPNVFDHFSDSFF